MKQLDEGVHDAGIALITFALAFRHQYLKNGDAGNLVLESVPDPIKRERRRDVIEKGLDSPFFKQAIARMLKLYADMEERLVEQPWLIGSQYTIADASFTPYLVRLDHLDIIGLLDAHSGVLDWYNRLRARPSFREAITKWENSEAIDLMKRQGRENWQKIRQIAAN